MEWIFVIGFFAVVLAGATRTRGRARRERVIGTGFADVPRVDDDAMYRPHDPASPIHPPLDIGGVPDPVHAHAHAAHTSHASHDACASVDVGGHASSFSHSSCDSGGGHHHH